VINRPFLYVMVHAPTGAIMHAAKAGAYTLPLFSST